MERSEIYKALGLQDPKDFFRIRKERNIKDVRLRDDYLRGTGATTNMIVSALHYLSENPSNRVFVFVPSDVLTRELEYTMKKYYFKLFGEEMPIKRVRFAAVQNESHLLRGLDAYTKIFYDHTC